MNNNKFKNLFKFNKMSNNIKLNEDIINEEEIIVNLMSEIFLYENKIKEINNLLTNNNTDINKNYLELSNLRKQKLIFHEKISKLQQKIAEKTKIKEEQIKMKESRKIEIENKIEEYKYQINTFNIIIFNSLISSVILKNKDNKNDILTNEQISDILIKVKKYNENFDEKKEKQNKDIIGYNKMKENNILNNIKEINLKINQIDETLRMLKEEKNSINNELINIISCKESIEALIKFNHYLIKNYQGIRDNKIDKNNDEEIYKKNKWNSLINLNFYELIIIDAKKFANGFNEIIFDLFDLNKNNKNSFIFNSSHLTNTNKDISLTEIIKKEFDLSLKTIKNGLDIFNEKIFLKSISSIIVTKLIPFLKNNNVYTNINEINENITIYLSYYLKSLYYEQIITENLKFINREYKYNKKELQKIISELNNEKKKKEILRMDIHENIDNNEKGLKIKSDELINNKPLNISNKQNNIKLSKEESNYLQICFNINNLRTQKNEILFDCETINNEYNSEIKELNTIKHKLNKELEEMDKKISIISSNIEQRTIKVNSEIIELRKIIAEKYNNIKTHLKKCKIKCGENTDEYNSIINSINETLHQKNKGILDINEIKSIKLTSSYDNYDKGELRKENLSKTYLHSSCDNKDKYKINIYASNQLSRQNNYFNRYFNSRKEGKEQKKTNLKSFSQIGFYKGLYNNRSLNNNSKKRNSNIALNKNNKMNKLNIINSQKVTNFIDNYAKNLLNAFENKKNYNSINLSRSINSIKNNKTNKSFNYNNKNKEKIYNIFNFNTTDSKIQHTNQIINNYPQEISQKLNPLLNITFCYIRKIETKIYHKYNPIQTIKNSNPDSLTKSPYFFTKATISLNKSYKTLRIVLTSKLDPIDINIKEIKYTTIRTKVKIISEIYRDYKKFVKNGNENFQKDLFIKKEMEKYNLSYDYVSKCIENNKFNLMLYLENGKMVELLFYSYEEFKNWINGFAFIIKNKDRLLEIDGEE